jgi:hypothetical protein
VLRANERRACAQRECDALHFLCRYFKETREILTIYARRRRSNEVTVVIFTRSSSSIKIQKGTSPKPNHSMKSVISSRRPFPLFSLSFRNLSLSLVLRARKLRVFILFLRSARNQRASRIYRVSSRTFSFKSTTFRCFASSFRCSTSTDSLRSSSPTRKSPASKPRTLGRAPVYSARKHTARSYPPPRAANVTKSPTVPCPPRAR